MTLIELVLSVAIAALVISLVFTVYHTVSVTMQDQEQRRRGADAAAEAVQQMTKDLTGAFAPEADEHCAFTLAKDGANAAASQLSFCTAVMPENETDLRWFEIHRVSYRIEKDTKDSPVLMRESQPLTGPGAFTAPATNILATGIDSFRVSAYDAGWKDEWASAGDAVCPRAVRIELTARYGSGAKIIQTEVLIPAGNSATPMVARIPL